jgi:hypothetical protein
VFTVGFLEVKLVVEMNIKNSEPTTEKESVTKIDVTEIIGKVSELVNNIKGMSGNGKPDVKVDSFTFSFSKTNDEYTLTFNSKIEIKPKAD